MTDFALARRNMIEGQLRPNRVTHPAVLAAIADLPRERFLPDGLEAVAYADDDVPVGDGRYAMEPMVLARLVQALQPDSEDRALVIASGGGYGAGLLGRLVKTVVALESIDRLAKTAEDAFKAVGLTNVQTVMGKLEEGARDFGPYNVVLVEGAVRQVPQNLLDQVAEGGRLATVLAGAQGGLGNATLMIKKGGVVSGRPLFDAGTPALPDFAAPLRFTF